MTRVLITSALALVLGGCGAVWTPVAPDGDAKGEFVLAETDRFARALDVRVVGRLTDEVNWTTNVKGERVEAAGWYSRGVAYYWRPWVTRDEATYSYLSALAAHEVCHARHFDEAGANACAATLIGTEPIGQCSRIDF